MTLLGRFLDVATLVSPGTLPAPESHIMLLGEPLVLVAEDDAILAFSIAEGLERSGFRVAGPFARMQ